jgi:Leucine-rich repeat (LRR) protein
MKPFLIFILFFIGMATPLAAQNDCYKNLRREGLSLLKKKSYRQAVDKFFAARYCPNKPEKDDLDELIKQTQDQWVAALDQAQQKTALALAKADSALTLANKIIDAFYFYKDSFALAFKDDKYGFINKKGEVVIDYDYKEALPFDFTGFARVKKHEDYYLIDTKGTPYRLAREVNQLDSNVVALDLRDRRMDTFPTAIFNHPQLKILLLSENPFTRLPEGWGQLKNLEFLHLAANRLTSLPESIGQLRSLRVLNLFGNPLKTLPESIGELDSLRELDVAFSDTKLTVPATIGQLRNLQVLNLSAAGFRSLPETIGELKNLRVLNLRYTALDSLPTSLGKLSQLQSLNLDRCELKHLPESIGQLRNLQHLNVSHNELTSLPATIGQLSNLKTLELYENELRSLPESIGQLKRLQKLDLHTNPLAGLPETIGQLSSLQTLSVSVGLPLTDKRFTYYDEEDSGTDKQFTRLPASIIQLSKLEDLYLQNTRITSLPEKIGQLRQLRTLSVGNNALKYLPESIGQLSKLEDLDVSNNLLTNLPSSIGQLTKLQKLNLNDNPIRKEALQKLPPAFYIENLLRYADRFIYEEKYDVALNYYKTLAAQKTDAYTKKAAAAACSNITFKLLFEKKFKVSLEAGLLALQFDAINANLYTNLPLAYLFNNQFEKAKAIYLAYKNKMYNEEQSYKMVFLNDFDDLESKGITHPDIAKIRLFLEK